MLLSFDGAAVRVVMRDGEPWFVANDAAKILGYADPTTAVKSSRAYAKRQSFG
jgi:prophage antirepressor-like protein